MDTTYERTIWCETCNHAEPHTISLQSAKDSGVIFLKACNTCSERDRKRTGNEILSWEVERIPVNEWNALILTKLY